MNINLVSTFSFIFCCLSLSSTAQEWELELETDEGIKIYTRLVDDEPLKQVKMEFEIETALTPLVSLITNPDKYTDFVYSSLKYEQKDGHTGNGLFYGQLDFPWPLSDRDFYLDTRTTQDPITKAVTINTRNVDQKAYPAENGFVRITAHHNIWTLTPGDNGMVQGEYWLKSDPCGSIPQWAVNMMIYEGSAKTLQQLFQELKTYEPEQQIAFIQEK